MTQQASRIVLDPDLRPILDQIQAKTRTTSPSSAIALMITRYARHLLETWELDPTRYPDPDPANYQGRARVATNPDFVFDSPVDL